MDYLAKISKNDMNLTLVSSKILQAHVYSFSITITNPQQKLDLLIHYKSYARTCELAILELLVDLSYSHHSDDTQW